ncbi:hypothetical protein EZV73_17775 [Acidaminobacter sp. JC074]|uniref:hypothetical protein n=1 Tax=Acidaminobacter sp. JC074 TaxID=2530199 RepID=UPI001F0DAF44|nr:hypothetical protein [Acidaminobacter sp. JC074]MCH4889435.1 hypothetical protein [Acidaminobacter sp. JC074]
MVFRTNGATGWLFLFIFILLVFSIFRFAGWVVFSTPVGIALVGYIAYRYIKGRLNKPEVDSHDHYEPEFKSNESVVDVEFEEVKMDE